ncbi:hypothetical protein ACE1TH_13255 [Shouchella sp. JSM 1781072]|uniref:hypothetical protein n=1 Tax=Shouchella sp. JSM 1781072 TaxID=3344581 RepID=UPI0035C00D9F
MLVRVINGKSQMLTDSGTTDVKLFHTFNEANILALKLNSQLLKDRLQWKVQPI